MCIVMMLSSKLLFHFLLVILLLYMPITYNPCSIYIYLSCLGVEVIGNYIFPTSEALKNARILNNDFQGRPVGLPYFQEWHGTIFLSPIIPLCETKLNLVNTYE